MGRSVYSSLLGAAVGALLTGLVLPAVIDPPAEVATAGGGQALQVEGRDGELVQPTDGSAVDGGGGADGGSGADGAAASPDSVLGSTSGAAPGPGSPAASGATARSANEPGLTDQSVRVGFLLLDVAAVGRIGIGVAGVDPAQQERAVRVQVGEINAKGGIHGRKIEPVFRKFDSLSLDDMRAACLYMTQDVKAFAVVAAGGYNPSQGMCVTREAKTPLITMCCAHDEYYRNSGGRMFTIYSGATRMMLNWIGELDRIGALKGKRIGILSDERYDPGSVMHKTALLPALQRFGYDVAYRAQLSADLNTGASQLPVEVQQMRRSGVDAVLLVGSTVYSQGFVQAADQQRYDPDYFSSDWAGMNTDATNQAMPRSYEGSINITADRGGEWRVGMPETPPERTCRERYERATGERLDRGSGDVKHAVTVMWCDLVNILAAGLQKAGPTLSRELLTAGLQNAGEIPVGGVGGGALRAGKPDLADLIRTKRWHFDCKCWKPVDQFRRGVAS